MNSPKIEALDDAIALVRRRPSMFLAAGVSSANISAAIAHDARLLGAESVSVERHDDWTIVFADVDWLSLRGLYEHDLTPAELFHRIVPFPEDGPNSMRHEILAAAFAREVVSAASDERLQVTGTTPQDDPIWRYLAREGVCRAIAFRGVASPETSGA